jgi:diamine N-acetyltransferase
MLLENDIIKLRALEPEDLESLYVWENQAAFWIVGNTRQPYSRFQLKQYILQSDLNLYENLQLRLIIEQKSDSKAVGTVDLFDFDIHNSRIALGLFVDEEFQGMGIAKSALQLIEDYVFNFLKINQLYCHIADSNIASRNMFEKMGYEKNGVLKDWIKGQNGFEDIIVFQRFK